MFIIMVYSKIKNVLYIGNYNKNYPRNYIFINGLKSLKINVFEINTNNFNNFEIIKYFLKNFKKLKKQNFDVIIYFSMKSSLSFVFAKIISYIKKIPLIHDIFISKFLTNYYDRNLINKKKYIPNFVYWFNLFLQDFLECQFSNYILLGTSTQINYFYEKFKIPIKKFGKIFVAARNDIFFPRDEFKKSDGKFRVGFWGSYIPVQGVKYIIRASKLLENHDQIFFYLIGTGTTYEKDRNLAKELKIQNVKFIPKNFLASNQLNKLAELISSLDIGLGLFGEGPKIVNVIPNKIFEGIAMKIPMITADTPGIRELFKNNENIVLCNRADPESLANAILKLKNNKNLREKIKHIGYELFKNCCSMEAISISLRNFLNRIV